ncbi:putative phosphatidate phosphatase [Pieris napi]|uniref:putative phosphatidate phosphatase n=1 Tax=Pieris napi TaxID=78633 RepID=UPI001FB8C14B|nr:putative phosphatidate phosphatase [Pieris napi]
MSREERSMHLLRKFVIDCFCICTLIALVIVTRDVWQGFERGFFCGDESLMYPYKSDTVSTDMLRLYGIGLPAIMILFCEWMLLRKEDDEPCFKFPLPLWMRGFYCVFACFSYGMCFVELTTNVAKNVIGRPRPHFFDLCRPNVNCSLSQWQHRYIESHEFECTGNNYTDKFNDMHMSFLSGHSSWSAYTMIYLALYLEKRMVWGSTRIFRHVLQFTAVMLSWYTALSRVTDYKHHWSDVLAGYFTGLTFAVLVWTWGTDLLQPKSKHQLVSQHEVCSHQQKAESA